MKHHTSNVKKFLNNSYSAKHKTKIGGYTIDKHLSGKRAQVYKDSSGKAVVVHRGTQGIHDMITDAKASLGFSNNKRFKHAKKIQRQAEAKYGSSNTTTMGHSLGGLLAERSANKKSKVVTLNKAGLPGDRNKKIKSNQIDIRTSGDLVSHLTRNQKGGKKITIKSTTKNPLKEHTTNVLNRINTNI
jgi:hypothetical protein